MFRTEKEEDSLNNSLANQEWNWRPKGWVFQSLPPDWSGSCQSSPQWWQTHSQPSSAHIEKSLVGLKFFIYKMEIIIHGMAKNYKSLRKKSVIFKYLGPKMFSSSDQHFWKLSSFLQMEHSMIPTALCSHSDQFQNNLESVLETIKGILWTSKQLPLSRQFTLKDKLA